MAESEKKKKSGVKMKNTINSTKMEKTEIKMKKFVKVQMNNTEVKFLLDISSDVILINKQNWKKISRPMPIIFFFNRKKFSHMAFQEIN